MKLHTRHHAILVTLWLSATAAAATEGEPRTVNVIAGEIRQAARRADLGFGENYRTLWTTPIEVEVLDLGRFASGLTPLMRVGGEQTKGLALKDGNGPSQLLHSKAPRLGLRPRIPAVPPRPSIFQRQDSSTRRKCSRSTSASVFRPGSPAGGRSVQGLRQVQGGARTRYDCPFDEFLQLKDHWNEGDVARELKHSDEYRSKHR